ncbi:MAG: extracellular solute-binding protein [Limnochordia bacterium]
MSKLYRLTTQVVCLALLLVLGSAVLPVNAKVPIVMWLSSQPVGVNDWAKQFQDEFNAQNPDIDLTVEVYPSVSTQREKLLIAIAGGVAPDIFYESSNAMGQWMLNQVATPLDKYLDAMPDKRDLMPDVLRGVQYQGKIWALPFSVWPVNDLYNLDLFSQQGIALPRDWDEMITAARRLTKVDPNSGAVIVNGYRRATSDLANFIDLQLAMEQLGATVIDVDATKSSINSMEGRQALNYMYELGLAGMPNGRGGSDTTAILNGTVAVQHMFLTYTMANMVSEIQASGRNFRVARYVGPEAGKDLVHHNAGTLFMVSNTKYPDAAWRVMQAWIERDNLKNYLMAHGSTLSVRISQATDNDLRSRPYAEEMMFSLVPPITSYGPTNPFFTAFRLPAGAFITQALKGQISIESALEQAQSLIDTIIAEEVATLQSK